MATLCPSPTQTGPPRRGLHWGMSKCALCRERGHCGSLSRVQPVGCGEGGQRPALPGPARTPDPVQPPLPTPSSSCCTPRSPRGDNKLAVRLCHRRAKGGRSLPPRGPHWNVHFLVHQRGLRHKTLCTEIFFSFRSLSHNTEEGEK